MLLYEVGLNKPTKQNALYFRNGLLNDYCMLD